MDNTQAFNYRFQAPPGPRDRQDEFPGTNSQGPSFQNSTPKEAVLVVSDTFPINPEVLPRIEVSRGIEKPASVIAGNILGKRVPYDPGYIVHMLEYFMGVEKSRTVTDYYSYKNGATGEKERELGNPPPMFSEFGRTIGVSERTLKKWAKEHVEFGECYEICQDIIKEFIVHNGVTGAYSGQLTVFIAKNITTMKDLVINENRTVNMKQFLDALEKGQSPEQSPV